jgi:hypothetical protein
MGCWLLHYDNSLAHTVLSIKQLLVKHSIPTLLQSPYSSDLSHPDFFLFLKLKITIKVRRFQTAEDIITNVRNDLKEYHIHSSNSTSKIGIGSGRGALLVKGTILKGIIFHKVLAEKEIIYRQIWGTSEHISYK